MKEIHFGLLPRILVAIVLGIGFGCFLPGVVVRGFATFNSIFSHFLQFLIPLIIIGLVTPAIAEIGKGAGVLLAITALIAYLDTVFAGCFSYLTSVLVFPKLITGGPSVSEIAQAEEVLPFFTIEIPPMTDVMTALVFSFTLGLGMAFFGSQQLKGLASEFKDIVVKTIETAILPLLPIYIFGIFLSMTYTGQAWSVLKVFVSIIGVIFLMHIVLLVLQFCVAGAVTHRNPFRLLWRMLPAYLTFYRAGNLFLGGDHPRNPEPDPQERGFRRSGGLHRPFVCNHPFIGQYAQDCLLRGGADDDAGHALRRGNVPRLHSHAGHHDGGGSGRAGRRHYGGPGRTGLRAGLR